MARRPDVFDREGLEGSLRRQGCAESFISPTVSDFRLFVPLLLSRLGEEEVFRIVNEARDEFGLGEQEPAWRTAVRYIVGWAEEVLEEYKSQRGLE
jgi:hypothetical protein